MTIGSIKNRTRL